MIPAASVASTAANVTVTNLPPPAIALTAPANNAAFAAPATISLAANVTANGHTITKVQFYNGASLLGEATTAPYAFTWGSVPAGIYSLSAQAVYDSGSAVASTTASVTVTNQSPPTIALTSPANNAAFTAPATINLAANVTANGHAITKVQFYNGTTLLGEDATAPYVFTWSAVAAGNYSLSAQAVYDSGSAVASTTASVTVTNQSPPTIALTSPANNTAFTAPATISLAANITANGHAITKVQFYNGATLLGEDTTAPYVFSWNSVAAGNYSLSAQVVYDSGSSIASPSANVTVTNLLPPSIALTSPADKAAFTAPATINLAANVIANGHAITKVQFYNGTTLLGEGTTAPYVFTWNSVAAGNYSLSAQVVYDSGSTVASTAAIVAVTKEVPPAIALTSPVDNSAFTAPATISLAASVTANGHAITKVQFYNGTTLLGENATAPYLFTWDSVAAGNYSLSAQVVYDSGSIVASTAANVTVTNLLPPTIALTSPANNSAFTAPATISLAANVTANGHAITKVQFYSGTTFLGENATAPYVFTWNSVAAGNYSLSAQVVYDSGSSIASTAANVTVTNLLPPTIALTSPANNSAFTAPATISLAANVTTNGHAITAVQFYNGTALLGESTNAPYAFTWDSVPAGAYSLTARLVYDAGATVDSTPAINVLVAAPSPPETPPTISPIADQTTPQDTPTPEIPFTVGDAETAASNLTVYAISADPALVPTNNIVFGGTDTNRTITLTPMSGATGNVAITVFVSDGSLTTNTTFQLAVTATLIPSALGFNIPLTNLSAQPVTTSSIYNGLFYQDDAVRLTSAGSFTLSVTPRGSYSGKLQIGTKSYSFSGSLNSQKTGATKVISRLDGPAFTLDFQFGLNGQASQVTGHLTDGTWTSTLCGDRAVFGSGQPSAIRRAITPWSSPVTTPTPHCPRATVSGL